MEEVDSAKCEAQDSLLYKPDRFTCESDDSDVFWKKDTLSSDLALVLGLQRSWSSQVSKALFP